MGQCFLPADRIGLTVMQQYTVLDYVIACCVVLTINSSHYMLFCLSFLGVYWLLLTVCYWSIHLCFICANFAWGATDRAVNVNFPGTLPLTLWDVSNSLHIIIFHHSVRLASRQCIKKQSNSCCFRQSQSSKWSCWMWQCIIRNLTHHWCTMRTRNTTDCVSWSNTEMTSLHCNNRVISQVSQAEWIMWQAAVSLSPF